MDKKGIKVCMTPALALKTCLLVIIGLLLASGTINIVQSIRYSCANLETDVETLKTQNNQLISTKNRLTIVQDELKTSLDEFEQHNQELNKDVRTLSVENSKLTVGLEELDHVQERLQEALNNLNSTLVSLDREVGELIDNLTLVESKLRNVKLEANETSNGISKLHIAIEQEVLALYDIREAFQLKNELQQEIYRRDTFYETLLLTEVILDKKTGFLQGEYDLFFRNIYLTLLTAESKTEKDQGLNLLKRLFPFELFNYQNAKDIMLVL